MEKLEKDIMAYGHHQASCLSCMNIIYTLYNNFMQPRDRFVLSKAHASGVLYHILEEKGLIDKSEIPYWPSHCTYGMPGVEFTGGSLGMGLGVAAGIALSLKNKRELGLVICLVGDGELYEGSNWEAIMFAAAHKLNNLICIVDRNFMSASDFTESFLPLESLEDKFDAFNWDFLGVNEDRFFPIIQSARFRVSDVPLCLIINTVKGRGYKEFMANPRCHTMKI